MPVRVLEEQLVNMIAAGEVVERPASVVKELVENALDASATRVRVSLGAGGRNLVSVDDDGQGMDRADALLCLERHATSKIRAADDLFAIGTLGFRGEAIPSIASVSRFSLTTKTHDADMGTRVRVEGGRVLDVTPAGCPAGTEVVARDLFFNVPARRKFLRSTETELGHCQEAVTREALIRPDVDWEIVHDGRTLLRAAPTDDWRTRATDLLGPHGAALVPADFTRGTLEVRGLVSPVGVHRQSPQGVSWIYVNGRFVKDPLLRRAVTQAYAGIVPKDRYPVVVLDVRLPPADVDVNVHPAKTEVRFSDGQALLGAVIAGLRACLTEHGIHRPVATETRYLPAGAARSAAAEPATPPTAPVPLASPAAGRSAPPAQVSLGIADRLFTTPRDAEPAPATPQGEARVPEVSAPPPGLPAPSMTSPAASPVAPSEAPPATTSVLRPVEGGATPAPRPSAEPLLPVRRYQDLRVLGQLGNTYLVCEGRGELVLIDQHAAHERVNLQRLERNATAVLGGAQQLLTPILIELPAGRARLLEQRVDELGAMGLDVRAMGGATFAVQTVPAFLRRADIAVLLADLADEAATEVHGMAVGGPLELVLATMACHGSVKAGQELSHHEMRALLAALDEVDVGVCAHGRPVAVRIGASELERRFHRT